MSFLNKFKQEFGGLNLDEAAVIIPHISNTGTINSSSLVIIKDHNIKRFSIQTNNRFNGQLGM
ncbi:unnamed protein product [Clonostachys chloroleuca]|uniref:Uncharacterized protein n=1 Tax=Clonostachys chloroleuca TaxID=1926264 RepID=A0AA35M6M0_9HYPO|nr:unnamed protein product [Clonostachys chloroleuca]